MKLRYILIIAGIATAMVKMYGQKEMEVASGIDIAPPKQIDAMGETDAVQRELDAIQQEISQISGELSPNTVEEMETRAASIEQDLEHVAKDVSEQQQKSLKKEIEKTRKQLQQLKTRISRQKEFYLEAQVKTTDPVTFVRDIDEFEEILDGNELVVAYFYQLSEQEKQVIEKNGVIRRTDRWYTVDQNGASFVSVAKRDLYRNARVQFIAVNLSADDLGRLKDRYDIKTKDTIMLFQGGTRYTKNPLRGPFDTHDIRTYVDRYFEKLAKERAEELEKQREKKRTVVRKEYVRDNYYRPRYGIGWGVGYGHPYYGYGYPYRYGYGHGYHGYPHFGFSIGV